MGRPERDRWMARFLAEEAEAQTVILRGLRGRLERGMAAAEQRDADAIDAGKQPSHEPPSREWVRAASLYFDGYRHLAQLQIEHAKLQILRERMRIKEPMSDEEFAAQIEALGRQAVRSLSDEEFEAEARRRRGLPAPMEGT